jgi:hypothetical protein
VESAIIWLKEGKGERIPEKRNKRKEQISFRINVSKIGSSKRGQRAIKSEPD